MFLREHSPGCQGLCDQMGKQALNCCQEYVNSKNWLTPKTPLLSPRQASGARGQIFICILRGLGRTRLGAGGDNARAASMHDQFQAHVNCASTLPGSHLSHSQPVGWGRTGRSLPPHWDKRRCCLNQLYREDCRENVNPLKSGWCLRSP